MKTIKISQAAYIILIVMTGGKFLLLPSKIAAVSGRDSWLVFAAFLVFDFAILLAVLYAEKLNRNKLRLNEILHGTLGCVFERVFYALLFVFFFARIIDTALNCLSIFGYTLTLRANWLAMVIPMFVFMWINLKKGFDNLARVVEFLIVPILLSTILIVCLSAGEADIENLRPILAQGLKPVAAGIKEHYFWFGDMAFLIFLLGRLRTEKHSFSLPLLSFAFGAVITLGFVAVFLGIFGNAAMFQKYAIAKISQFDVRQISQGRLDWLFLVFWLLSSFLKINVGMYCSLMSLKFLLGVNSRKSESVLTVSMFAAIAVLPVAIDYGKFAYSFFGSGAGAYFIWLAQVFPFALPFLTYAANKGRKKKPRPLMLKEGKLERKMKL